MLTLVLLGCNHQQENAEKSPIANAGTIEVLRFNELESYLSTTSEDVHIVNFWAMWCVPCVKELPLFDEYVEQHPNTKLLLVSMDFPEDIESKLKPFLKRQGIKAQVVILDEADANSWIDKIDPSWSGAIPFTIVFNKNSKSYHEGDFSTLEELAQLVNQTINK